MSLLTEASLVILPNAVKAGKLYSIIPTNGAGDLDVVRATSATRVNSSGLIEIVGNNIARLDYTNGSCPSILVEPQRTNLLFPSVDNGGVNYDGVNLISKTINFGLAPDGTMTATRILANNASWRYRNVNSTTLINSTTYTFTFWAKSNTLSNQIFRAYLFNQTFSPDFTATQQWQRYTFTLTTPTFGTPVNFHGLGNNSLGTTNIDILTWGWQIEVGSNATSYIPTTTTAVTRNADVISKSGISSLIGQTEGTLYWEGSLSTNAMTIASLKPDSGSLNAVVFDIWADNRISGYIVENNVLKNTIRSLSDITFNSFIKIAYVYKSGNCSLFINGVKQNTSSQAFTFNNIISKANIDYEGYNYGQAQGKTKYVKNCIVFPTILSDAKCISLTTL